MDNKIIFKFCLRLIIFNFVFIIFLFFNTEVQAGAIERQLAELEKGANGRLGIALINTANNEQMVYRANELFAMCSTSKVMVASAMLKKNGSDKHLLAKNIKYKKSDLISYSPITEKYLEQGLNIEQLIKAALQYSDNTATNLLLAELGGVQAVNKFARSINDRSFRLDRPEPELNTAIPDDKRDTTTPLAMAKSLQQLAFGNALAKPAQMQLIEWMKGNTTGDERIRAGLPDSWQIADKTGSGSYGTTNDIAIIWPDGGGDPLILVIFFTQNKKDAALNNDILALATRIVTQDCCSF